MEKIKKLVDAVLYILPLLSVYPKWAQCLFVATAAAVFLSLTVFVCLLGQARDNLDASRRPRLSEDPYPGFQNTFRSVIPPYRLPESGSVLHIVWGDLAAIRNSAVVVPVSQSFDFQQRGPRSILAAFESHTVDSLPFYTYLDRTWPHNDHPPAAAIGTTKFFRLREESNGLEGVLFVVTTRDHSRERTDYGVYKNTPLDGIDLVLDRVLAESKSQKLSSIAVPLLGAGYANVQRTFSDPKLKSLLEHGVALLTIDRMLKALADPKSPIRRGIVVVYSSDPQGRSEDELWQSALTFIQSTHDDREKRIKALLKQIEGDPNESMHTDQKSAPLRSADSGG